MFPIAASFLVLSGIASLTYQVTWVRLLGLSMGTTSASVATVLAAYFLGMAAGSYGAERIMRNRGGDLRPYLILEAVIGVSGIALLPLLLNLDHLVALVPALGTWLSLKFALALTVLAIPTICMGATFPVMAGLLIHRDGDVGARLSLLYGLNTAGAVLGAALCGFWLIPNWGLTGAVYVAAFLNLAIAATGLRVNAMFRGAPPGAGPEPMPTTVSSPRDAAHWRALLALFATGFAAIASQVAWTKYLAVFAGTTIYGFAAILTVFLAGIAVGSLVMKRRLDKIAFPGRWLALGLVAAGVCLLLTRAGLTLVPPLYRAVNNLGESAALVHSIKYAAVFALIIGPTLLFGAIFPLNLKLYCGGQHGVRSRVGRAYAVNTLAGLLGAVCAGFWLIPSVGTDAVLTGSAFLLILVGLAFAPSFSSAVRRTAFAATATAGLALSWVVPHVQYADLIASVQYTYDMDAKGAGAPSFLFLKEGATGVVSMASYGQRAARLQNNGLNESLINLRDPEDTLLIETLLGIVPYALQEQPRSALVVGFGGGITTHTLTFTDLARIDVVELEPVIVEANLAVKNPHAESLSDPRVSLRYNDARNDLIVHNERYDIIAAQPSHPWLARASNVFTLEFWEIVQSRLTPTGVFSQWVNLFNMDATTLRSILKAFYSVFPHGFTLADLESGDMILLGSNVPLQLDMTRFDRLAASDRVRPILASHNIRAGRDLLWYFSLSREEALAAAGDAEPNTDTNILSEVRLAGLIGQPKGDEDVVEFIKNRYGADYGPHVAAPDTAQFYYQQALYFASWDNFFLAKKTAERLKTINARLARSLEYEILWRKFEYNAAFELYASQRDWPPRVHLLQALALLALDQPQPAAAAVARIADPQEQRAAQARLLYESSAWDQLAALEPQSDEERRWQLVARARDDASAAGAQLGTLIDHDDAPIPQLRVMVQRASRINDSAELDKWANRLSDAIDNEIERLRKLAEKALDEPNPPKAFLILRQMEKLDPQAKPLRALHWRLDRVSGLQKLTRSDARPAANGG